MMDAWNARALQVSSLVCSAQQSSLCTLNCCEERSVSWRSSKVVLGTVKSTGKQLLKHVVPAVIKPMRVLWNEVIGFVFLALGAMMGLSTYRNFRDVDEKGSPIPLIGGLLFALLMIYFGVTSFLRARRISRS